MTFEEDQKKLSWRGLVDFLAERKETSSNMPKDSNKSIDQIQELDESSSTSIKSSLNPNESNIHPKSKEYDSEKIISNKLTINNKFETIKHDIETENKILNKKLSMFPFPKPEWQEKMITPKYMMNLQKKRILLK